MAAWVGYAGWGKLLGGCNNDPGGSRTRDLRIKSPLLYQLSYRVVSDRKITQPNDLDNR